jgi:hypothetical protein
MYNGRQFRGPSPPLTPKRPPEAKRDQRNQRRKQNLLSVALCLLYRGGTKGREGPFAESGLGLLSLFLFFFSR